ncbi:MAG: hypothetical protein WCE52_18090 [Candidatus Acidiferrum sp.]
MKTLFIAQSADTALTGLLLLISPSAFVSLLFGSQLDDPLASVIGRGAGVTVFSLGAAWWILTRAGQTPSRIVGSMLFYDAAVMVVLLSARFNQRLIGIGLWPAIALHFGFGIWCLVCFSKTAELEAGSRQKLG